MLMNAEVALEGDGVGLGKVVFEMLTGRSTIGLSRRSLVSEVYRLQHDLGLGLSVAALDFLEACMQEAGSREMSTDAHGTIASNRGGGLGIPDNLSKHPWIRSQRAALTAKGLGLFLDLTAALSPEEYHKKEGGESTGRDPIQSAVSGSSSELSGFRSQRIYDTDRSEPGSYADYTDYRYADHIGGEDAHNNETEEEEEASDRGSVVIEQTPRFIDTVEDSEPLAGVTSNTCSGSSYRYGVDLLATIEELTGEWSLDAIVEKAVVDAGLDAIVEKAVVDAGLVEKALISIDGRIDGVSSGMYMYSLNENAVQSNISSQRSVSSNISSQRSAHPSGGSSTYSRSQNPNPTLDYMCSCVTLIYTSGDMLADWLDRVEMELLVEVEVGLRLGLAPESHLQGLNSMNSPAL